MAFSLPDGLAPEVYPLAWLVGRWRGEGVVGYPGIEETAFTQDVVFDHDGGPYLRYTSTIRLIVVPDDAASLTDEGSRSRCFASPCDRLAAKAMSCCEVRVGRPVDGPTRWMSKITAGISA